MKKRVLSILTALALTLGLCTPLGGLMPEAKAAEIIASGSTSSRGDVTWTLDSEGTFTFSGEGRPPYVSPSMVVMDWEDYKEQIKRVVIEDGITATGEYSFSGCTNLTSVSLADSVTSISDSTFSGCTGLTEINLPDSVRSIGSHAFFGCTGLSRRSTCLFRSKPSATGRFPTVRT